MGLVLDALDMALAARRPGIGEAVMHTDRGAQYTSHDFRDRCLANGVIPSVGPNGTCYDNAAAESFNATIKKELIHQHLWLDAEEARLRGIRLHRAVLQPRPETAPPGENEPCAL